MERRFYFKFPARRRGGSAADGVVDIKIAFHLFNNSINHPALRAPLLWRGII